MATASELPINTNATAEDMAAEMFGSNIQIVSATYTGATAASGIYSNGDTVAPDITPSDSGVILSTGNATDITNSFGDANISAGTTTSHGLAGDAGLDAISGQTTFDAAIFEASFIPTGNTLTMQFVFSSEEYLEYVNSGFNDAVGIWVNGTQATLEVGSGHVSIDEIGDATNENLYIDNPATSDPYNTEMDGFTVTLTLKAPVTAGDVNTIRIGIADSGDTAYDSNLLIAGDSIQTDLIATHDDLSFTTGKTKTFDLLDNDIAAPNATLTITHINGQPVSVGDSITLTTGETLVLTENGVEISDADNIPGTNSFTYTVSDGLGNTDVGLVKVTTNVPCFTLGTLIETPDGKRPIETLRSGDLVTTRDNGHMPIRWIGSKMLTPENLRENRNMTPISIKAGSLGGGLPLSDLIVSPQHRILITSKIVERMFGADEVLIAAKKLLSHTGVSQHENCPDGVTYFHILLDGHQVVYANGTPTESLYLGAQVKHALSCEAQAEIKALFPDLWESDVEMQTARPIVCKANRIAQLITRQSKNKMDFVQNLAA